MGGDVECRVEEAAARRGRAFEDLFLVKPRALSQPSDPESTVGINNKTEGMTQNFIPNEINKTKHHLPRQNLH